MWTFGSPDQPVLRGTVGAGVKHRFTGEFARRAALGFALALGFCTATGCFGLPAFACAEDRQCVSSSIRGTCQDTGYCSFPDDDCGTGQRYSTEAPRGLAGECVDAAGGTESDSSQTGGGESGELGCLDQDGDGFGEGTACNGPDCDDDNPGVNDTCLYLGPDGDDGAAGTAQAPWRTFAHAIAQLQAGDSLVVLDGEYDPLDHGPLEVVCEGGVANGTMDAPIFVRAENTRGASVFTDGRGAGIRIESCQWWRIQGLSCEGADRPKDEDGSFATLVNVVDSDQIELRDLLIAAPNRYFNNHAVLVSSSTNVLLEDVEAYDFYRIGFSFRNSSDLTCRRCYANSREAADLPGCPELAACEDADDTSLRGTRDCPNCSAGSSERGDIGFSVQGCQSMRLENCVSERSEAGYQVRSGDGEVLGQGGSITIEGSLSLRDGSGIELESSDPTIPLLDIAVIDTVIDGAIDRGIQARSVSSARISGVTITAPGGDGLVFEESSDVPCSEFGGCELLVENTLIVDAGGTGLDISAVGPWSMQACNVVGSTTLDYRYPSQGSDAFDDDDGNARACLSTAPTGVGAQDDQCLVYVPEGSNMKGIDGAPDIGANIVTQLDDGVLTELGVWSPQGPFRCAPAPGTSEEGCHDLHLRARVGQASCPVPEEDGA